MVGLTGSGKSSTGNNILASVYLSKETPRYGKSGTWGIIHRPFKTSASGESVTTKCEKIRAEIQGRLITIVDTPGFYDTNRSHESSMYGILECMLLTAPGPHVVMLLVQLGRQTNDVINGVKMLREIFGEGCLKFVMIVFTGGDKLKLTDEKIADVVKKMNSTIKDLIKDCADHYLDFDNTVAPLSKENIDQVNQVLTMAEEIAKTNEGSYFSDDLFQRAADIVDKRLKSSDKQIKELKENKKKLEEELREVKKQLEDGQNATEAEKARLRKEMEDLNKKIEVHKQQIKDLEQDKEKIPDMVKEAKEESQHIIQGNISNLHFVEKARVLCKDFMCIKGPLDINTSLYCSVYEE